ncbi:MAG TPA: hypothetical protein VE967_06630, partial [Gemmatimonadaceae bacterium]|nr:hypothetical protein [Gemmatimonadaceae bacterium]
MRSCIIVLSLGVAVAPSMSQTPTPSQDVPVQQWQVPYEKSTPRDPSVAPDGRIWFVGQIGNYLAVFDPKNGSFKKYAMPDTTFPHSNVVAP